METITESLIDNCAFRVEKATSLETVLTVGLYPLTDGKPGAAVTPSLRINVGNKAAAMQNHWYASVVWFLAAFGAFEDRHPGLPRWPLC